MGISMSRKAQTFSMDFLIASTVFVLAFSILYVYWTYTTKQINETRDINDMIDKVYLISQIWFRKGTPEYWNPSNVIDLGLASDHRFNQTKMDSLTDPLLDYDNVSDLIGVETYDFYFRIYNTTNDLIYDFGLEPSSPENVIKIKRVGILNRNVAIVEVMVWE